MSASETTSVKGGLKTSSLDEEALIDEVLGNKGNSSAKVSFDNFSQQLLGMGPLSAKIDQIGDQFLTGLTPASSWPDLQSIVPTGDDVGSTVPDTDTGSHLQATATGYDGPSVPNAGEYRWVPAWSRWLRVSDNKNFATLAQGEKADTAAQRAEFFDPILNTGGKMIVVPDTEGGSVLAYDARERWLEAALPVVWPIHRVDTHGLDAAEVQEGRAVAGRRGGEHVKLVPLHASLRLALLADTHGVQQLFAVSENQNLGTNWARQLTCAQKNVTGYDWVRLPDGDVPGVVQITTADQPFTRRRNRIGRVEVPIKTPVDHVRDKMYFIAGLGQSKSGGADAGYHSTRGAQTVNDLGLLPHGPLPATLLRFNGGVIPHQLGYDATHVAVPIDAAQIASFVPLRAGDNTNGLDRETYFPALAAHLNGPEGFDGEHYILAGTFGFGGRTFEELALDGGVVQQPYQNLLDAVQAAQTLCTNQNLDLEVVLFWDQGEADANDNPDQVRDSLVALRADALTRIGAITGQTALKMFISQTIASQGSAAGPALPAFGQSLAGLANSDIHLLPASYFADPDEDPFRVVGSTAVIHHTATAGQTLGALFGTAMASVLTGGNDPALRVQSATYTGSQITLTWNHSDVVIDRDTIQNLGVSLGLKHLNMNGPTRQIERVYMTSGSTTVIQLNFDVPAGADEEVSVGNSDITTGGNWCFGYARGPRSAFRRRDPIGYSRMSGEPLFVFAEIQEITATEV